jgi:dihydroorotate dehydrogenase
VIYRFFYKYIITHTPDKYVEKIGGFFFRIVSYFNFYKPKNMEINIGETIFTNPVGMPSGWVDDPSKITTMKKLNVGIITLKTITYNPKTGNKYPRLVRGNNCLINSMGLPNKGFYWWLDFLQKTNLEIPIIISIKGDKIEEWIEMIEGFSPYAELIELNFSCPNVSSGIMDISNSVTIINEITKVAKKPILLKLSPEYPAEQNLELVQKIRNEIYGITIINTVPTRSEKLGNPEKIGGKSGKAVHTELINQLQTFRELYPKFSDLPIFATGGIDHTNVISIIQNYKALPLALTSFLMYTPFIYNKMLKTIDREIKDGNLDLKTIFL